MTMVTVTPYKAGSYRWMKTTSDDEYKAAIDFLIQQTRTIFSNHVLELRYVHNDATRDSLLSALKVARDIDRSSNWWNVYCMYVLVFQKITRILKICSTHIGRPASFCSSQGLTEKSHNVYQKVKQTHYRNSPTVGFKGVKILQSMVTEIQTQDRMLTLPPTFSEFPQLNGLLRRLKQTYEMAEKSITTTEEEYLMEQIRKSYLPMISTTMSSTQHASAEIREKVESELAKQIEMMGKSLRIIINDSGLRALREAETQTGFLSQKLTPQVNALSLNKAREAAYADANAKMKAEWARTANQR